VAFVPAAVPPHREAPLSAAADRLTMVRLATAAYPAFEAWDIELAREGPSYTVETVDALVAARASDWFVLVVGATRPEISWREPQRCWRSSGGVVDRPGSRRATALPRVRRPASPAPTAVGERHPRARAPRRSVRFFPTVADCRRRSSR
jgi:nicotinate-nucleotide adenylyltransferase